MVAAKVEIVTKSYKDDSTAVSWTCDGSPTYNIVPAEKVDRELILFYISQKILLNFWKMLASKEFLKNTVSFFLYQFISGHTKLMLFQPRKTKKVRKPNQQKKQLFPQLLIIQLLHGQKTSRFNG